MREMDGVTGVLFSCFSAATPRESRARRWLDVVRGNLLFPTLLAPTAWLVMVGIVLSAAPSRLTGLKFSLEPLVPFWGRLSWVSTRKVVERAGRPSGFVGENGEPPGTMDEVL